MRILIFVAAAAGVLLTAMPALAQDRSTSNEPGAGAIYVGGFLGDRFGREQTLSGATPAGLPRVIETDAKDGLTGGGLSWVPSLPRVRGAGRASRPSSRPAATRSKGWISTVSSASCSKAAAQ